MYDFYGAIIWSDYDRPGRETRVVLQDVPRFLQEYSIVLQDVPRFLQDYCIVLQDNARFLQVLPCYLVSEETGSGGVVLAHQLVHVYPGVSFQLVLERQKSTESGCLGTPQSEQTQNTGH